MPVIINEIEVLEPPANQTPGQGSPPAPCARHPEGRAHPAADATPRGASAGWWRTDHATATVAYVSTPLISLGGQPDAAVAGTWSPGGRGDHRRDGLVRGPAQQLRLPQRQRRIPLPGTRPHRLRHRRWGSPSARQTRAGRSSPARSAPSRRTTRHRARPRCSSSPRTACRPSGSPAAPARSRTPPPPTSPSSSPATTA